MSDSEPSERDEVNRDVLGFLHGRSAHSDVADALRDAVGPLGDVQIDCPNWSEYRYVTVSTKGIIFGFAIGMETIGLRVGPLKERAIRTGADDLPQAGEHWAEFTLWRPDWPRPDLEFWARKAYLFAREPAAAG
jgi:hypothetical protein